MESKGSGIEIENPAAGLDWSAFESFRLISYFTLAATREKPSNEE